MPLALALVAVIALAAFAARRADAATLPGGSQFLLPDGWQDWGGQLADALPAWPSADTVSAPEAYELEEPRTGTFDDLLDAFNPTTYIPPNVNTDTAARNERAFLDTIAMAEGTARLGDRGYNVLVGGTLFESYADHPRRVVELKRSGGKPSIFSSAAGRYQFIRATWDDVRARLGLTDFSPASQDRAALELIRRRGALNDVQGGRFATAIDKCRKEWASLPGAGYGQPERSFTELQSAFLAAGGTLTT